VSVESVNYEKSTLNPSFEVNNGLANITPFSTFNLIIVNFGSFNFFNIMDFGIVVTPKSLIIKEINYSIRKSKNLKNGC